MSQHFDEPLSLETVAAAQGVGVRRLEQLFRDGLGQGPGAAYLELRLQAARRMMADTTHPIQEIALRAGFADRSSFSRAFRRRFGVAPRVARSGH
ncbi:helix-turn-helix domain-containing protein [Pararhodobacter zhoushanensis]|uniref:Helix-turn-helix domain-containing protein n=1 Tax=Pararhodobacter zhoushanensis TaxID=2479545 RepID=A0ABT3GZI6_9RHOB|nr:helix-turn-helix domain-containing protein [Pararhodobacter zhoushanensis]MCW1932952.1 helix-turn-helix domain-containing protein [Pararhodobacter zhoushanensis]